MARKGRRIKRKKRYCKRCGGELSEGYHRWCPECLEAMKKEYKDCELASDYVLNVPIIPDGE
jgi:predicted amidophosphoribosyltransferase